MTLQSLPLFPLGTTLFPGGKLPLRIFEVRYLDMINKCIKAGAPFGIIALKQGVEVQLPESFEVFSDVGTLATITHHATPQAGLKIIDCLGIQRFNITRRERLKHGLWVADVELIAADMVVSVPGELANCSTILRKILEKLPPNSQSIEWSELDDEWNDCAWISNRWCEILPIPLPVKQRMLELNNPLIRLELVSDLLEKFRLV